MSDYNTGESYNYINPNVTYTTTTTTAPGRARRSPLPIILLIVVGILLLFALLYLLFGAGGGNGGTQNGNNNLDPDKKVVLQWWGVFMDEDVIQPLIDEYQAQNPNVTIEYADRWPGGEYTNAEKSYRGELNRIISNNDPVDLPDIFMVGNTWAGDYEKYAAPSTEHTKDSFANTFYPAVVTDFAREQLVYGIPLWIDTYAILYNRDILESKSLSRPPETWPEFKSAAKTLTSTSGGELNVAGFGAGTAGNVSFAPQMFLILLEQNGVLIQDTEEKIAISTDQDSLGALQFYKDFVTQGIWSASQKNDSAEFLESDVAMIFAPSWRYRDILNLNERFDLDLDIGVSRVPQLSGQDEAIINWSNYWANMVSLNRPNSAYAWDFLNWLTQPDQLKKISENVENEYGHFGILYPRIDMSTELQNDEFLKVYNESLPTAKSWYPAKGIEADTFVRELINSTSPSLTSIGNLENRIQELIDSKGTF